MFHEDVVLEHLYRTREWFQLLNKVSPESHLFYRGCVACAFNRRGECYRCFQAIIRAAPHSRKAYQAHKLLSWVYLRRADFRQVLAHHEKMRALRPGHQLLEAGHALFAVLGRFPRQSVTAQRASTREYTVLQGNMFIPALVNGQAFNFMLDSGASISFMTESAARHLHLTIHDAGPHALTLFGATGQQTGFRVAVVSHLTIGQIQIANVVFLVLNDEQFQFPLPYGGALGLSVILAFRTLRWDADGRFCIGSPEHRYPMAGPNLCFDGVDLVTEVMVQQHRLSMLLDTGNATSFLWPPFARRFAGLLGTVGSKGMRHLEGVSGTADVESIILENLELEVGAFAVHLRPAHVLLKTTTPNSNWLSGWLGIDILKEAHRVTLDFNAMTLLLE